MTSGEWISAAAEAAGEGLGAPSVGIVCIGVAGPGGAGGVVAATGLGSGRVATGRGRGSGGRGAALALATAATIDAATAGSGAAAATAGIGGAGSGGDGDATGGEAVDCGCGSCFGIGVAGTPSGAAGSDGATMIATVIGSTGRVVLDCNAQVVAPISAISSTRAAASERVSSHRSPVDSSTAQRPCGGRSRKTNPPCPHVVSTCRMPLTASPLVRLARAWTAICHDAMTIRGGRRDPSGSSGRRDVSHAFRSLVPFRPAPLSDMAQRTR